MKNVAFIIFLAIASSLNAQLTIDANTWDDPVTFQNSGVPLIADFGESGDSLALAFSNGTKFYAINDKYTPVNSWADYYLWYTQKYWYRFSRSVDVYAYFHKAKNNLEMMNFIFNNEANVNYILTNSTKLLSFSLQMTTSEFKALEVRDQSWVFDLEAFSNQNANLFKRKERNINNPSDIANEKSKGISNSTSGVTRSGNGHSTKIETASPVRLVKRN